MPRAGARLGVERAPHRVGGIRRASPRRIRTSPLEVRSDGLSSEMLQPRSLVELVTARLREEILSGRSSPENGWWRNS